MKYVSYPSFTACSLPHLCNVQLFGEARFARSLEIDESNQKT